jgi:CBS domain containing-hemolysin-like protein
MVKRLDAYLSVTQFGVTLSSLGLGWIGEPAFAHLIQPLVEAVLPAGAAATQLTHTLALAFAFGLITFLHIILGELVPKGLAIQKAESTALAFSSLMRFFYFLFYPAVWVLTRTANRILTVLGSKGAQTPQEATSEEELRVLLSTSAAAGAITASRAELLERALSMVRKTVRQVLVPRSQVRFLDLTESLEQNIANSRAGGHTWLPVCRGSLDAVEGVVNVQDLFFLLSRGELKSLDQVQRPVLFVPESATLEQLLSEFRRRRRHMAVVVDEHGGTSGIVTIADVVAEVVGEIAELGQTTDEVKTLPGGRLELPGTAQLGDLAERLDVKFDVATDEITTIAGYVMAKLGRVPAKGDRCTVGEYEIEVQATDGPRVRQVLIQPHITAVKERPGVPPS